MLVVTHGLGDVNRYANGGAFVVQLCTASRSKRIGLDSPATTEVPKVPGAPLLRRAIAVLYAPPRSADPCAARRVASREGQAWSPHSVSATTGSS